jgi:hypothetical protein
MNQNARLPRLITRNRKVDKWIDMIVRAVERALSVSCSGNIVPTISPSGIHLHVPFLGLAVIVTTSTITARSGATPGQGTMKVVLFNGTTLIDDASATAETMYNYSSASGGVATGKYGIAIKVSTYWFLLSAEC